MPNEKSLEELRPKARGKAPAGVNGTQTGKSAQTTLDQLPPETPATIQSVGGEGALRQHFLDMGVIPGARVQFVKSAPLGDPLELTVRGYELSLRKADAEMIEVE